MAGQLNKLEMISITTLAAAVGVPLQAPDRGLLPVMIIAAVVIALGRVISVGAFYNRTFEIISQDKLAVLVQDSVMQLASLKKAKITRERLFAFLRSKGCRHLGEVSKVYLEAGGFFTLVRRNPGVAGLIILPLWDRALTERIQMQGVSVCAQCGARNEDPSRCECSVCGHAEFQTAGR